MLKGSLVAIVTPMFEDGSLDLPRLRALIDFHIREGTNGIVIVGTTGESPTVDFEEHCLLIRTAIDHAAGRVPVIAGTGANSTREAIELSAYAKQAGADMSLSVVPYYNKPTQEGNVPGRTVADMQNDTALRLAQVPNIVGLKDATGNMERGAELLRRAPKNFAVYSGDDGTGLALLMLGAHGVISVTANVAPRLMQELCAAVFAGDFAKARSHNNKLLGLHRHLFVEANPIPVKWVLQQMGQMEGGIRLPLTPLSSSFHDLLRGAMEQADIGAAVAMPAMAK